MDCGERLNESECAWSDTQPRAARTSPTNRGRSHGEGSHQNRALYNPIVISDIDALNIHITALATELGFVASAKRVDAQSAGIAADSTRIQLTVADMTKTPPRECSKSVTLADYQDVGIHTFDDFIRFEAPRALRGH